MTFRASRMQSGARSCFAEASPELHPMKYFGSTVAFTRERNADIMRVFRQKLVEADFICVDDICRQVAESPASRFWVSAERAAVVISSMEAGRAVPPMRELKREMFEEIFRRYKQMRLLYPEEPLLDLVAVIVNQEAPKFYFSPRTIREYVRRIRSGYYDRNQCNLEADGFSEGNKG